MIDLVASRTPVEDLSPGELLRVARSRQADGWAAELDLLRLAAQWAVQHPTESILEVAVFTFDGSEGETDIAGPGCPQIAEFACAEFGAALGVSTTAAKKLIGHALELQHRLPRTWERLVSGGVAPWRARLVAGATIHACPELTPTAVAWIDHQVAGFLGKIGTAQIERLVAEAILRFKLLDEEESIDQSDSCRIVFEDGYPAGSGVMNLHGTLTTLDALDLNHAVTEGAAALKSLGCTKSLDWRRAKALAHLARTDTSLSILDTDRTDSGDAEPTPRLPVARRLDLNLHLSAMVGPGGIGLDRVVRLDEGHRLLLIDQIKGWCADTLTEVRVHPILDLNEDLTSRSYTPSPRLRRQVIMRDKDCMFPWCNRSAWHCDLDHVDPFCRDRPPEDQTTSSNLIALCRHHHRLKTHGRWCATSPSVGVVIWTDPHGIRYRCDHTGTTTL